MTNTSVMQRCERVKSGPQRYSVGEQDNNDEDDGDDEVDKVVATT